MGVRNHVIITGTGRAGTTFLVALLTHLGLDTGFQPDELTLFAGARAGLEHSLNDPRSPYIVKSPFICDSLDGLLRSGDIGIDLAVVPVRRFAAAAANRALVQSQVTGAPDGADVVPGGLWDTPQANDQARVLREKFTRLVEALARHDVPTELLWYPRLIQDPDYLHSKLRFLVGDIPIADFRTVFDQVVRPDWVHRFAGDDNWR